MSDVDSEMNDWREEANRLHAEIARLRALLIAPPAQMSDGRGNLIAINSDEMRQVIDDNHHLRAQLEKAEAIVRAAGKIWGVIPVTGPGTLGPDVAVPLLAYEELRMALALYRGAHSHTEETQ